MVEPISMAIMATGKAAGTAINFFEDRKQRQINEALVEGQVQALQDQIDITKIQAARKVAAQQGAGVVKAGSQGVQFSGSVATTTAQLVTETEFGKIAQIQNLKYQQRVAELQGESKDASLASQQLGGLISGASSTAKGAGEIKDLEGTDALLKALGSIGG